MRPAGSDHLQNLDEKETAGPTIQGSCPMAKGRILPAERNAKPVYDFLFVDRIGEDRSVFPDLLIE